MTKEELKQYIDDNIYENQDGEITGESLNAVLKAIVDDAGTKVEANPTGEATTPLNKLKIGETNYNIPQTDTSTLATKQELQQGLNGKQDTISDLQQIRTRADEGHTALQPIQDATPNNFASFDENGGIKDSLKKASDFATSEQGTKADNAIPMPTGTDGQILEKDSNETAGVKWVSKPSDGKSAYEIWLEENGHQSTDPGWSEQDFLASLKAQFGSFVPADYGTGGKPASGGTDITASANTTNYIYLVDNLSSNPTAKVMWITVVGGTELVPTYTWENIGEVQVATEFLTGEQLDQVPIDNTNLDNPASNSLAKAEDIVLMKQQLRNASLKETKAAFTMGTGYINESGVITGTTDNAHAEILINGIYDRIRFLGLDIHANASPTLKKYSYAFYNSNNTLISNSVKVYDLSEIEDSNAVKKEYIITIPTNASKFMCSIGGNNRANFYCYLESGKTIHETIEPLVNGYNEVSVTIDGKTGQILAGNDTTAYGAWVNVLGHQSLKDAQNKIFWTKPSGATTDTDSSYYINLSPYKTYGGYITIKSQETRPVRYTFAKELLSTYSSADNTSKLSSVMSDGYVQISADTEVTIEIPEDAVYIYFIKCITSSSIVYSYEPYSVVINKIIHIQDIDTRVSNLEEEVNSLPSEMAQEYKPLGSTALFSGYKIITYTDITHNRFPGKAITDDSGWSVSAWINVSELVGKKIRFVGCKLATLQDIGFGFYNTNSSAQESYVVSVQRFDYGADSDQNVIMETIVPQGAVYFRTSYKDYGNLEGGFYVETYSDMANLIIEVAGENDGDAYSGITHLRPDNIGQLNAVRRMRKQTDIEWTPAFDISRGSTAGGKSFYNNKFLAGKTYKGIPYARADKKIYGYTDANTKGGGSNGANFKIGFYVSIETFMTAICNRGTVMEAESTYSYGSHQASFYANVCAGGVSAALGLDYIQTDDFDAGDVSFGGYSATPTYGDIYEVSIGGNATAKIMFTGVASSKLYFISAEDNHATIDTSNIPYSGIITKISGVGNNEITYTNKYDGGYKSGFSNLGRISSGVNGFDLKSLKLGDVIALVRVHTAMVTDVIKDKNGNVTHVEISENTTQGNGNYTIEGFELGGVARRLWWTVDDFLRSWNGYRVLRYQSISSVPYTPSPYVPMPDENYGYARYTMAVLPYMGNGFRYMLVDSVVPANCRKLVVEEPRERVVDENGELTGDPVVFWNKKIDGAWVAQTPIPIDYTDYNAETHPYVYVALPSNMGIGEYEAYISILGPDTPTPILRNSTKCYWQVVSSLPLLEDY